MAYFRLRSEHHDFEIPPGDLVVGRSDDCGLILDDPLVSRRHARFRATESELTVEDLGSRNGVAVNDVTVRRAVALHDGDTVTIGDQKITVHEAEVSAALSRRQAAMTLSGRDPMPARPTALGSRSTMIEAALRSNDFDAAEYSLGNVVTNLREEITSGRIDAELLAETTAFALRLAAASEKPMWLDTVFSLHRAAGRVLAAPVVDDIHVIARKIRYPYGVAMRSYVELLQGRVAQLSPTERFVLQRLEGLGRVLRA